MAMESSPASPHTAQHLSIDETLQQWVGEFGWAQLLQFTLASLAWSVEALQTFVTIFADKTPKWHCISNSSHEVSTYCNATDKASICSMNNNTMWEWVGGKRQSTVSEWGLLCGDEFKMGFVQSFFFIGALLGAGLFGNLSDTVLGRKGVLAITSSMIAICGMATAFSPNYWIYLLLRTMTGMSSGGLGLTSFVLATEPVGPSKRGMVGMSCFYFYSAGIMVLCGLAYTSHNWRYLYLITSCPALLFCIISFPFLLESPRWYLVQGRKLKALHVLKLIAHRNGNYVPQEISLCYEQETNHDLNSNNNNSKASGSLLDVFKTSSTRLRMIIMLIIWFSSSTIYYGVSLNVSNLGTNLYTSVLLNAMVEIPGYVITAVFLDKFGRRTMLVFAMLLSGLSCILGAIVSENSSRGTKKLKLAFGALGIFGMAATYNLLYIYASELFPTVVRNAALGLASQAGQIGAIIAPMVVLSARIHASLPFAIFGITSIFGGVLALKLPETLNQPLYETFEGLRRGENQLHGNNDPCVL